MELMKNERKKLGLTATLHVKKGPLPGNRPFALKIRNKTNVDVTVNESLTKKAQKAEEKGGPEE